MRHRIQTPSHAHLPPAARGDRSARAFRVASLLGAVLFPAPFPAVADDRPDARCFEGWAEERLERAYELRDSVDALFEIRLVDHVKDTSADPGAIDARLHRIARARGTEPLVAAEIDAILLESDLSRGDLDAAATRRQGLGIVERYRVARSVDVAKSVADDHAAVPGDSWRSFDVAANGLLPFGPLFHPDEQTAALATFWVASESPVEVALRYGADDSAEVDLNGTPLPASKVEHDLRLDQHALPVTLAAGWNRITFRVAQKTGAWLLIARLTSLDGSPLPEGVSIGLPESLEAAETTSGGGALPAERATTVDSLLEARRERRGRRGDRTGAASALWALEAGRRQAFGRGDGTAVERARRVHEEGDAPTVAAWVLSVLEEDASRRREWLESILAVDPRQPAALRRLARHYFEHGQDSAALRVLDRSIAGCPAEADLTGGWKMLLESAVAFPGHAIAVVEPLIEAGAPPSFTERLAVLYGARGLPMRARSAYERYLEARPGDIGARAELADLALRTADGDRFVAVLEAGLELHPYRADWLVRLVRFHLVGGRLEEAEASLERLRRLDPDDPVFLSLAGDVALAEGSVPDAIASMRRAIEEGGPPGPIEERIGVHAGRGATDDADWTLSLADAEALFEASEGLYPPDAPAVVVSRRHLVRLKPNGMADRSVQVIRKILEPEQAAAFRFDRVNYSPGLQRFDLLAARLARSDGAKYDASRSERALLPDPDLRIWYDSRVVTLAYPRLEAGDTLVSSYRISDRGANNPIGEGYFGENILLGDLLPVLSTRVVIEAPAGLDVYHALNNLGGLESATTIEESETGDGGTRIEIELPPLAAATFAPGAPPATERVPYVVISTSPDWDDLGATYARLMEDQLRVTPDIRSVVEELTSRASSQRELIEEIYGWVIENTRYVALEFGIHAIKPYDVGAVFRRRHGDCKDKASLLVAMLEEAGIDARVALLRTRNRGDFDTRVPSFSAFDHAIVYVPGEELWLDGTVLHHGSRELPTQDRGSLALIVSRDSDEESRLVTTPEATTDANAVELVERIEYRLGGEIDFEIDLKARGEAAATERAYLRLNDRRQAIVRERLRRVHPDIGAFRASFGSLDLETPEVAYSYRGSISRFGRSEGGAASVPIGIANLEPPVEIPPRGRDVPLELPAAFSQSVSTRFVLGKNLREETLPRAQKLESEWGTVELAVAREGGALRIEKTVSFRGGIVEPDEMDTFATWAEGWRQLFGQRLRLQWN